MIHDKKVNFDTALPKLDKISEILEPYNKYIVALLLFGSVARNQITPLSDIDLAILYKKGLDKKEIECIESEIYATVSSYLETDEIDFINLNEVPLSMQYNIIKGKKFLIINDKEAYVDFETTVVMKYLDFKPYRDEFIREYKKYLLEGV